MSSRYNAADIEVLSGLEPVKRRPGMYTDTTRPNHLAQGSRSTTRSTKRSPGMRTRSRSRCTRTARSKSADDGRGMPVDIHPEEGFRASS